jgi:site-specific DNA-methyltransferase (cytosine-N4-specific)
MDWRQKLLTNSEDLPPTLAQFCRKLCKALTKDDGFRRQAGPSLIYRYFVDMKRAFSSLCEVLRKNARVAIVVGANHTTLGGQRFDIDTPRFLRLIAQDIGYRVEELIGLQTYQRYGLHQKNSIQDESLIILEWPKESTDS